MRTARGELEAWCYKHSGKAAAEIKELRDLLTRFRNFVSENGGVRDIATHKGEPTNHHNPIWVEVANALDVEAYRK